MMRTFKQTPFAHNHNLLALKTSGAFDKAYLENISNILTKIVLEMEIYLSQGEDDSLKDVIAENMNCFKQQQKKVYRMIRGLHVTKNSSEK